MGTVESMLPSVYKQVYSRHPIREIEKFEFVEPNFDINETLVKNDLQNALTSFREEMGKVLQNSPICESNFQKTFNQNLAEMNVEFLELTRPSIVDMPEFKPMESVNGNNKLAFAVSKLQDFQARFQ